MLFKRGIFKPYFMGEGKHGKPFLLEHPQIQFNISHCKNAVLCGIGSKPLGVDVETIRPMRERVLRRNAVPCTAGKWRDSCSNAGICRSRSRCRIPLLSRHLGAEASLFRLYSQGRITEKGSRMCHSAPFFFGNIQERN